MAALARARQEDVDAALRGIEPAAKPRLHVFLATSDLHLKHKLRTTRSEALAQIIRMVRFGAAHCENVEFSAEDASRSDIDFFCEVAQAAADAGAKVINLPDTVGYSTPEEYGEIFRRVRAHLSAYPNVELSAHCHNDLGLAVANSLAAMMAGARQIECTINGIGERAGNASLEEIAVALQVRQSRYNAATGIVMEKIYPTSRMLSSITGVSVPPNKAVVGANAFAHEAGIHQDGILKNPLTYEIILPEKVGVPARRLVLVSIRVETHCVRASTNSAIKPLTRNLPTAIQWPLPWRTRRRKLRTATCLRSFIRCVAIRRALRPPTEVKSKEKKI